MNLHYKGLIPMDISWFSSKKNSVNEHALKLIQAVVFATSRLN